jgi:hypothetical protein
MPIRRLREEKKEVQASANAPLTPTGVKMNWKRWFVGLANAVLSGLTSGGLSAYLGIGWKKALMVAAASFYVSLQKWLNQHPLPGAES